MRLYLTGILLLLITLFAGCDKEPNNTNNNNTSTSNIIYASVNGYSWGLPSGYVQKVNSTLVLNFYNGQLYRLTIQIANYQGIKTYFFDGNSKVTYVDNNVQYDSIKGQVTISSDNDNNVSGNFECELISGSNSLVFSQGQFTAPK